MRFVLILLFSVTLNAQTLLNETFNNFFPELPAFTGFELWLVENANNPVGNYLQDLNGDVSDFTGGGGIGTFNGGSVLKSGANSLYFDGTDDYLQTVYDADHTLVSNFTILAIIKPSNLTQTNKYFLSRSGQDYNLLWEYVNNSVEFYASGATGDDPRTGTSLLFTNVSTHHVIAYTYDGSNQIGYLDGVQSFDSAKTFSLKNSLSFLRIGQSSSSSNQFQGNIEYMVIAKSAFTSQQIKEVGFLANNWMSLNGGVTRSGFGYNQGVVSDTIYYNTALTAGSWTITLSDSAASGVSYEVLTSADAATWTTLATGTTGTSWGSKSYSGTGTGYIAISVASGTAFFDDLVVSSEGGKKTKYNGFNGRNKY